MNVCGAIIVIAVYRPLRCVTCQYVGFVIAFSLAHLGDVMWLYKFFGNGVLKAKGAPSKLTSSVKFVQAVNPKVSSN